MQLNKTLMLAALAAGICATPVSLRAQNTNAPMMAAPRTNAMQQFHRPIRSRFDFIAARLALTEDEKTKVKPVFDELDQKMMAIPMAERRTKSMAIREAALAKLKDLLTAEQYAKCQQMLMGPRAAHPVGAFVPPATAHAATNSVKQ